MKNKILLKSLAGLCALAVDLLIWYPFFKTYEKQEVEKEAAEALAKA